MRGAILFLCAAAAWADADLILHNGRIVTVDAAFSVRRAVAVERGKIAAAGTDAEVMKQRGPATQVIDLEGRTVLPGLVDSHVHALGAGLSEFREALPPLDSFAAVQAFIRARAQKTPKGQWIVVPRTFPTRLREMKMPTREVLDVATDHPVMFDASYTVVVNTAALKMNGITRATPNPPGGEIVKDSSGEPNGILKNATRLLKGLGRSESFTEAEKLKALEDMHQRYLAAGLTAISDRAVTAEDIGLYRKLKEQGKLAVRAVLTWRLDASPSADEVIARIRAADFTTGTGDEWLKFGAFKVTLDGGMTIGTAYQRVPYEEFGRQLYGQTRADDRGLLFIPGEKLTAIFRAARDRGWQLTAHCQGGGAVDTFLDALEALDREKPIAPSRSHLMHASFQSAQAIARAKKMGVLADVQTPWLYHDGPALAKVFGDRGMRHFIPLRQYIDAGVVVAGGSDHMIGHDKNRAVNPYNPFFQMWVAVARKMSTGAVLHSEEKITRQEALKMHTAWAAHMQSADRERGSIETGKLADMVVVDRDFLAVPEDAIKDIGVVMTLVAGKVAYRAGPSTK
ncbi:MAG: amidohydrolase [Bryobacteraceae bacterium]